jgi:hypothetical protein
LLLTAEDFVRDDFVFKFYALKRLSQQQRVELQSTLLPAHLFIAKKRKAKLKAGKPAVVVQRLLPQRRRIDQPTLLKQAKAFHARWCKRIEQLRLEADPPRYMLLTKRCLACKPAFFGTTGKRYYCRLSICPYCHARGVYQWYRRLAYVLNKHKFIGKLVIRQKKYTEELLDVDDNLGRAVNLAKYDAKQYWRRSGAAAGLSFVQLLPGRDLHGCTVVMSQLLYYLSDVPVGQDYLRVVDKLNLTELRYLTCYVLRYPPYWFYRRPKESLRVFTVLRNRNLVTANGLFYKVKKEEINEFDFRTIEPVFRKAQRRRLDN